MHGNFAFNSKNNKIRLEGMAYAILFSFPAFLREAIDLLFYFFTTISVFLILLTIFLPRYQEKVSKLLNIPFSYLHACLSEVFLFIFFFLVFTPFAFIFRITGRDLIKLKLNKKSSSYWSKNEEKRSWKQFFKDPF